MSVATPVMTATLKRALDQGCERPFAEDLMFLEAWEREPTWSIGSTLRAGQIRRANPELAAAIRAEVARR